MRKSVKKTLAFVSGGASIGGVAGGAICSGLGTVGAICGVSVAIPLIVPGIIVGAVVCGMTGYMASKKNGLELQLKTNN